jgi:hypothetical protein
MTFPPNIVDALRSLVPGCQFVVRGGVVDWRGPGDAPTQAEIDAELARLTAEWDALEYQRKRAEEYPAMDRLIVALWEQVIEGRPETAMQVQTLREAVKQKYPRP